MNWKYIFNTNWQTWEDFFKVIEFMPLTGYKFFNWNGNIYTAEGKSTGITVENCF